MDHRAQFDTLSRRAADVAAVADWAEADAFDAMDCAEWSVDHARLGG